MLQEDFAFGTTLPTWKGMLLNGLAEHASCSGYQTSRSGIATFVLVGRRTDVEIVRYMYAWLSVEVERLAQACPTARGRTGLNSFRLGAVSAVLEAMKGSKAAERATATSAALVRVDTRLAEAEAQLPKNLRAVVKRARSDRGAYERGISAGRSIHLGGRLGAGGARLLGSGS